MENEKMYPAMVISYRGYFGRITYDEEVNCFHGECINIESVITFQGDSKREVKEAFRNSVDDFLDWKNIDSLKEY